MNAAKNSSFKQQQLFCLLFVMNKNLFQRSKTRQKYKNDKYKNKIVNRNVKIKLIKKSETELVHKNEKEIKNKILKKTLKNKINNLESCIQHLFSYRNIIMIIRRPPRVSLMLRKQRSSPHPTLLSISLLTATSFIDVYVYSAEFDPFLAHIFYSKTPTPKVQFPSAMKLILKINLVS